MRLTTTSRPLPTAPTRFAQQQHTRQNADARLASLQNTHLLAPLSPQWLQAFPGLHLAEVALGRRLRQAAPTSPGPTPTLREVTRGRRRQHSHPSAAAGLSRTNRTPIGCAQLWRRAASAWYKSCTASSVRDERALRRCQRGSAAHSRRCAEPIPSLLGRCSGSCGQPLGVGGRGAPRWRLHSSAVQTATLVTRPSPL